MDVFGFLVSSPILNTGEKHWTLRWPKRIQRYTDLEYIHLNATPPETDRHIFKSFPNFTHSVCHSFMIPLCIGVSLRSTEFATHSNYISGLDLPNSIDCAHNSIFLFKVNELSFRQNIDKILVIDTDSQMFYYFIGL